MNRDQSYALIRQTFTQGFDRTRFLQFIRNLLNHLDESKAAGMAVPDAFTSHIRNCQRLGTYRSPEGELADVLIVHTTDPHKITRTRTALRDFVAHKLKRQDSYKEAGLIAFVSPDAKTWRFSYIRMEYETKRDPKTGKITPEERLTPARRFSYIVGEGESCHTAQTRFPGLLQDTKTDPKLGDIEEAFSVEAVTREFFKRYVELFENIYQALDKLIEKDKPIRDEFQAKNINAVDFAKKLLGQIVFLYFLQKKGWLGVEKGQDWGTGPHDFLRRMAGEKYGKYENYFNNILEPLFYDTLATDRGHEVWCSNFRCRIPFLNGGLFEALGGYDWRKIDILLPNRLFTNKDPVEEGIVGTGVLDVFDRYNFTVNEAEPLEKEVAIDPEMLGKVFENLIEENRRKGLGAYYTPREIVHYMCRESLINYLDTALNVGRASSLPSEDNHKQDACATIFFDPDAPQEISGRNLPHWRQSGTTYYLTFRLADSMPQEKLQQLTLEREAWLKSHPEPRSPSVTAEYHRLFSEKVEQWLDAGAGSCVLREPDAAKIVADALKHFDGERYRLGEWVVMPNHVHVLVTPLNKHELSDILHSWKSFTANKINEHFHRTGTLWQHESYDHIVRSDDQLHRIEQYIRDNPAKVGINVTQTSSLQSRAIDKVEQASSLDNHKQDACATLVPRKDIETFVHVGDQAAFYEAARMSGTKSYKPELPESIEMHARLLDEKLAGITVCDPAVGSGAFPVGMMTEIVRARIALTPYFDKVEQASSLSSLGNRKQDACATLEYERTSYHFKRHAIQNSLYGVDIDASAVEIAKLRLWLSLVVDEEDVKQVKPLPNLDYKVVAGNSLISFPFKSQRLDTIEKMKQKFFEETDHEKKAELKSQIDEQLQAAFASSKRSLGYEVDFDFEIYFSEVFHTNKGFDIVTANPPYVRQESIKALKPQLKQTFNAFYCGTADLYTYFYKRGLEILKPGGHLCFIAPNKFMRAGYGRNTRALLAGAATPKIVIDFGDLPIFDATTYPSILLVEKGKPAAAGKTLVATFTDPSQLARLDETLTAIGFTMPIAALKAEGWTLERPDVLALMEKLSKAGKPLGEYVVEGKFYYGIKTGLNEAFVIDEVTRQQLIAADPQSADLIKPWLRGRDIRKWKAQWAGLYVIFTRRGTDIEKYPAIKRHLEQFRVDLEPKKSDKDQRGRKPGTYKWFEIQDNIAYFKEFEKPKIIYPDIAQSSKFTWDESRAFLGNTAYIIPTDEQWLLGLLNSTLIWWFYLNISSTIQGGFVRFIAQYMELLPIPPVTDTQKAPIIERVRKILADPDSPAVPHLEAAIDKLVYALYKLTPEEIKIIEKEK